MSGLPDPEPSGRTAPTHRSLFPNPLMHAARPAILKEGVAGHLPRLERIPMDNKAVRLTALASCAG